MVYSYTPFLKDEHHAPCLNVMISNPANSSNRFVIFALIDTGSDITLIPLRRLNRIGVKAAGSKTEMQGLGGSVDLSPFVVLLEFNQELFQRVVWGWDEDFAIIGRDILRDHRLGLDGSNQEFEIF